MGLWIKEEFNVHDVLGAGCGQVGDGKVMEVLVSLQDREVGIVDGEEGGEVVEGVSFGLREMG